MVVTRLEVTDMVSFTTLDVSEATRAEDELPTTWAKARLVDSLDRRPSASGPVIGACIMSVTLNNERLSGPTHCRNLMREEL